MFKGSEGLEPGEFSKIIRSLGGNDNAFTSQDYTAYFQSIAAEHLEKVMTMEAGRMRGMNPPKKEVLSERDVIIEERKQRTDNNPQAKFGEALSAALYVNHPYGTPIIGWAHEANALSWEDAKSFYDLWYAPNNAILVVSGAVEAEEVFAKAEEIYGKLEPADTPVRNRTVSPPLPGKVTLTHYDEHVRQPVFQRSYRVPSSRQNKEEALALQVLEDIFGRGATSRLYTALVIEQKLAIQAGLSYRSDAYDDAGISVYATPVPGVEMDHLIAAIDAEIAKLAQNGVSDEELSDSLNRLQNEAIYARDSVSGPAMVIGYGLVTGSSLNDIENWPEDISKVTAAQIQNAAAKYLAPESEDSRYVNGILLPASMKPAPPEVSDVPHEESAAEVETNAVEPQEQPENGDAP